MTISSSDNRSGPYPGNGVTTVFGRDFRVDNADHLKVYQTVAGVTTEVTTGITKDGIGADTGNVTFSTAPPTGTQITLLRESPQTQETDYSGQGKVSTEQVEADLDSVVMMVQDQAELVDRAYRAPITGKSFTAGNVPKFDSAGDLVDGGTSVEDVANNAAAAAASAASAKASAALLKPYEDRAAAVAAVVGDGVDRISVLDGDGGALDYIRDATGTALLTNAGAVSWSPAFIPRLKHWGAAGVLAGAGTYMTTPTVDESTIIQTAFDWCLENGRDLICDSYRVYGYSAQLVWGANGSVVPAGPCLLDGFQGVWIGTSHTAAVKTDDDPDNWSITNAPTFVVGGASGSTAGKYEVAVTGLRLDGQRRRNVLQFRQLNHTEQRYWIERGLDYEVRIGEMNDDTINATNSDFYGFSRHYAYRERSDGTISAVDDGSGWYGLTGRTSCGHLVESSDCQLFVTSATALHSYVLRTSFSVEAVSSKFWNGPGAGNPSGFVTAIVSPTASKWAIRGGQIQDGALRIMSDDGQLSGTKFAQYDHQPVQLVASSANETFPRLSIAGIRTDTTATAITVPTIGSGSWDMFEGEFYGNINANGDPMTIQGRAWSIGDIKNPFLTRGALVYAIGTLNWTPPVGTQVTVGPETWEYIGSGTEIADMPGWVHVGDATPYHFADNIVPATTNMAAAILAAGNAVASSGEPVDHGGGVIRLRGKNAISQEVNLVGNGITLKGDGQHSTQIVLTGLTGNGIKFGDENGAVSHGCKVEDLSFVVPAGTVRTSGAHLQFRNVTGGGASNVDYNGFYTGLDIVGSAHLHFGRSWFRGRNRTGASNKAKACIQIDGDPTSGRGCTGIYIDGVDGVANNGIELGWVEDFILAREFDGVYVDNFHSNLADWAITLEAHDDGFLGEFRLTNFYLDKSRLGNMRIIGNTTQTIRTVLIANGIMRAAGGADADADKVDTAPSLLVDVGVDGMALLDIKSVRFDAPRGEAIKSNNTNLYDLRLHDCVFEDVNKGGNTGLYELDLQAGRVAMGNNQFIRGDATNTLASIYGRNITVAMHTGVVFDADSNIATRVDAPSFDNIEEGVAGLSGARLPDVPNWDTLSRNQFMASNNAADTGIPTALTNWAGLHFQETPAIRNQIAFRPDDFRFRRYGAGVWGDWNRVFHSANALSSVSYSGGAPTGGLLEHYTSGDWEVYKYADGRMEMTARLETTADINVVHGSLYKSANLITGKQTFPETFTGNPSCHIDVTASGLTVGMLRGGTGDSNNLPSTAVSTHHSSVLAIDHVVHITATGRWRA